MANTLQIKRGVWNTTGAPSSLSYGEIAWDNASEVLYIGKQTDAGGTITVTSLSDPESLAILSVGPSILTPPVLNTFP